MKTLKQFILLSVLGLISFSGFSQCANNNVLVSAAPANPTLGGWTGWEENFPFSSGIASGEYVQVNVCLGATYTFTMCDNLLVTGDPEMTLRTTAGGFLAYNDDNTILPFPGDLLPQITWTATFTGVVDVIIDQVACQNLGGDWMSVIIYQLSNCGTGGGPGEPCNADIGTFSNTQNGIPVTSPINLCQSGGDCLSLASNNDFILPPPAANNPLEVPELMWALYSAPPSGVRPDLDPNYMGLTWTGDPFADCNPSTYGLTGTIWFVPVLVDDSDNAGDPNGVFNFDQDGDGCFGVGVAEAMQVNYLNPITFTNSSSSCAGTVTVTVSGGEPEFMANNYTVTNTGAGTLTGTPISHAGTVTITGLTNGQAWSLLVVDANGCTNTINGIFSGDITLPVINCPGNINVNNTPGTCGATVNYTAPVGTDNCPSPLTTMTAGQASGTVFPVGTTNVSYLVTDAIGNTATCSFTVTVTDNENPAISCPGNINVNNTPGTCGATVNYTAPVGTDNCLAPSTTMTAGQASGTVFPVGTTTVSFLVTDAAGLTATCSFTVTVNDNENPVINCPANIVQCNPVVSWTVPTGTDNCPGASTSQTQGLASGSTFPVGVTTVEYTVTDAAGNPGVCSFTVEVTPTITPTFTQVNTICNGDVLAALPTTSNNGVTGTWSPALNNTATTVYTFTPTVGLCATTQTMTITVTQPTVPAFTQVAPICSGDPLAALPTTSTNGVTGTWSPAINNTTTTVYTFTPTVGLCATTQTMTITITPNTTPTFTQVAAICDGDPLAALPLISTNGVTGTWSPAVDNTTTTVYTFTPTVGLCATTQTMTITVNPNDDPGFSYPSGTYCLTGTDPTAVPGAGQTGGGTYTINAPGVINAGNGTIDLGLSGLGNFTVTYIVQQEIHVLLLQHFQ